MQPIPKNPYKRRKPKRSERNKFSESVRRKVMDDYDYKCASCHGLATELHHVKFRSQGGRGVATNALPLCHKCHREVHLDSDKARYWQDVFASKHGDDYYKDKWDKEDY